MAERKYKIRPLDFLLMGAIVAVSVCSMFFLPKQGATVVVTWRNQEVYRGPVDKRARIVTPDGGNTILVDGGAVEMTDANCPDGLCKRMGRATPSKPVVCLPNQVVVRVQEDGEDELDAVTY